LRDVWQASFKHQRAVEEAVDMPADVGSILDSWYILL
jgi:hypothetical protein